MKYRWTYKELREISDKKFIQCLINERKSTLNCYSFLYYRLTKLEKLLDKIFKESK